jgi:peptidoglycan hydrolase CwlO-like protein
MPLRPVLLAAAVALALVGNGEGATPPPTVPTTLAAASHQPIARPERTPSETDAFLKQMGDAQKWMGEEVWKIKDKVDALPGVIAEAKDANTATQEDVGKLREEVKGLYVELSTLKQQIEDLKDDITGVNTNVSSFRTSSGIFLAVVMLTVVFTAVMTAFRR